MFGVRVWFCYQTVCTLMSFLDTVSFASRYTFAYYYIVNINFSK